METSINRTQHASRSLIEFLLGDGIRPGWLDEQRHHLFARLETRLNGRHENLNLASDSLHWRVWQGGRRAAQSRDRVQQQPSTDRHQQV